MNGWSGPPPFPLSSWQKPSARYMKFAQAHWSMKTMLAARLWLRILNT